MGKWYFLFFSVFTPPPLFVMCLDYNLGLSTPANVVKKKKVFFLHVFCSTGLCETLGEHPKHMRLFSEIKSGSRSLSKDNLNVSAKAWLHAREGGPHTYPFLILLLKLLVTVRDRKLSKKVLGLEVFQRFITWLNLGKFSQV